MSVASTYTYNNTRDEIIEDALMHLGVLGADEVMSNDDLQRGISCLNRLLKKWGAAGLHIWKRQEAFLIPTANQTSYELGTAGDVCVSEYVDTTLSADEAIGQTIISVTDTTDFVNNYNIIIQCSDGTSHTSTISSFTSSTVTIADALTVAADSGAVVYVYSTSNKIVRPLKVLNVRRRSNGIDVPLDELSYQDYFDLPYKSNTSQYPTQWMYNPMRDSYGLFYLWPTPNDISTVFPLTYETTLADVTSANQNFDIPQEWLMALGLGLAVYMAPTYGKYQELPTLKAMYDQEYAEVLTFDNETVSMSVEPDWRQ